MTPSGVKPVPATDAPESPPSRSSPFRRGGSLVLTLIATVVAYAMAEIAVRIWFERPMYVEFVRDAGNRPAVSSAKLFGRGDEGLFTLTPGGWRLRPDIEVRILHHGISGLDTTVRTNSLGLRGPELGPKDRPRILFLGDSITLADYVSEEDTIPALVQRALAQHGLNAEAVNGGVSAIGTADELAMFKSLAPELRPDLVIVDYYLNDATVCCAVRVPPLPPWLRWSAFAYHFHRALIIQQFNGLGGAGTLDKATLERWRTEFTGRVRAAPGDFHTSPEAFNQLILDQFFNWGNAWSAGSWESISPLFSEFKAFADANGMRLAVIGFPVRFQVESAFVDSYPQQQLKALLERLNVPYLDLLPRLRAAAPHEKALYYDPAHPTAQTNALIADEIAKWAKPLLSASGS